MRVLKGHLELSQAPQRPCAVAIGNFDGVHLGHRRIVETALEKARALSGTAVIYTFRPHPKLVLSPDKSGRSPLLTTYDEKLAILGALGVECVIEEPFSHEFSATSPEDFFSDVLRDRLHAQAIIVGHDFCFGKDRAGGIPVLQTFCRSSGIELTIVPALLASDGLPVSSSRIRKALGDADLALAGALLGRPFSYSGVVTHGAARGGKIGFPTANLVPEKLLLPFGVYATHTVWQSQIIPGVTNIGVRPTFEADQKVLVETHLIGEELDLYGRAIEVRFVRRLREEKKFESVEALRTQIGNDVSEARRILSQA